MKFSFNLPLMVALILMGISVNLHAQFAIGGTGKYQRQIYWLPWHFSADSATGLLSIKS